MTLPYESSSIMSPDKFSNPAMEITACDETGLGNIDR
jgi:hypothetical protein